jgi:uncharacterized membrane protein YczE
VLGLRPATELPRRLPRLLVGLALVGVGIAGMVRSEMGLPPWSVLDHGTNLHTGIPIGTVSILVGAVVLSTWLILRERPGLGTVLNIVVIGLVIDLVLWLVPTTDNLALRVAYLVFGVLIWGPGSGLYIGAGLGPGPRDGLMTGLAARGVGSVRLVRTGLELTALTIGWVLGGSVGIGTLAFALTIGPNVQFFLGRLAYRPAGTPTPGPSADPGLNPRPAAAPL